MNIEEFMKEDTGEDVERSCELCSYFFQDTESYLGICFKKDDVFEPYLEDMFDGDLSKCHDLFVEKRYDGSNMICDDYEPSEIIDADEAEMYEQSEKMKKANADDLISLLYTDKYPLDTVLANVFHYVCLGNISSYKGLITYYKSLGPADNLEEVHRRVKIVEHLNHYDSPEENIYAYINELYRTPSNNTTRQLYTCILDCLRHYPVELVDKPLSKLLKEKKYGQKLTDKILDVIYREEYINPFIF